VRLGVTAGGNIIIQNNCCWVRNAVSGLFAPSVLFCATMFVTSINWLIKSLGTIRRGTQLSFYIKKLAIGVNSRAW
jgi:hypothetical protein